MPAYLFTPCFRGSPNGSWRLSPHQVHRQCIIQVERFRRVARGTVRDPDGPRRVGPASPAQNSVLTRQWSGRIPPHLLLIVVLIIRIRDPLPRIPQHVVQRPCVRKFPTNRFRAVSVLIQLLADVVPIIRRELGRVQWFVAAGVFIPGYGLQLPVPRTAGFCSSRILPFSLSRQAQASPLAVILGFVPDDKYRRQIGILALGIKLSPRAVLRRQRRLASCLAEPFVSGNGYLRLPHPEAAADFDFVGWLLVRLAFIVSLRASHGELARRNPRVTESVLRVLPHLARLWPAYLCCRHRPLPRVRNALLDRLHERAGRIFPFRAARHA